ncbi:hypothetical protein, partial [Aurantimonas sp. C2-4-R8]|nr:hypothetical protein [Aurantimonas sp. C2-4-R8]
VRLDDENRRHHRPREASLGPMGGQSRRKPTRTVLNIAGGAAMSATVPPETGVHMGNVGQNLFRKEVLGYQ